MPDRPPSPKVAFPLSPQQERLWSLHGSAAGPFTGRSVLSVRGDLDVAALREAVRDVAARHEILRTSFDHPAGVGMPVQSVEDAREPDFREGEGGGAGGAGGGTTADATSGAAGFDLRSDSLFRATLERIGDGEHRLTLTLPAICADTEGLRALAEEIRGAYAARTGAAARDETDEEPPQIADVAEWERGEVEDGSAFRSPSALAKPLGVRFPWAPAEAAGEAAAEAGDPAAVAFRPGRLDVPLDDDLAARLRELSGADDARLRSLLLAAWTVLLWKLAGRARICVGSLHDGRDAEELRGIPGVLARYLPLAPALDARAAFRAAAHAIAAEDARLESAQHEFGWEKAIGKAAGDPGAYAAGFDFARLPAAAEAGGVTFGPEETDARIDRMDARLVVRARGEALAFALEHDAARLGRADAERLRDRLLCLLRGAAADPDARIGELEILDGEERKRLVTDFNDSAAEIGNDRCVHRVIEETAARHPDRIAVEFGDEALSYAELNARANRLARRLRARGVEDGALVGIALRRSPEMVVSILAVLKAGGAYVPLDPGYPRERLDFMIEDTGMRFLVTRSELLGDAERPGVEAVLLDAEADAIAACADGNPESDPGPDSLVYVIYTSGSTGRPKGVMITHRGLMLSNGARRARFPEPVEKFLLLSSFSFDSSVVGIFWTLTVGGTLFLVPESAQRDLRELGSVIARHRVSHLLTLPSFYALLLDEAPAGSLESLRTVIVAGEPTRRSSIERHRELLPRTAMCSEYGATETTVFSSVSDLLRPGLPVAPLGLPIANCEMYVLDPDLRPLPVGVTGEVWFGGLAISPGYLNRPELTAERFLPDPFCGRPGARMYRSGDLARHHASGEMEFLGRIDNQVKIRGFRIELEEIEVALSAHPDVQEAVVLALDAAAWRGAAGESGDGGGSAGGEEPGGLRLAAYVVRNAEAGATAKDLRAFLAESLPDYMVPAEILLLEAIPRTPNGKVDRDALPAPGAARADAGGAADEARTPEEALLVRIWKEVLGLERVGIRDNFFEVGGDSILSIQIVSRAAREGLALTPMQAFQHQTIEELAAAVGGRKAADAEQDEVTGEVPPTAVQRWFLSLDVPERSHWNMPLLLEMEREPAIEHLQAAADALLRHHDALRLRLVRTAGGWEQRIGPFEASVPVDVEDLGGLDGDAERAELERRAAAYQAGLDVEAGRLMRIVVFRRSPGRPPLLFWVLHHLAGDIVSWRILLEDLQTALEQRERGEEIVLPAKTTSFRRWAEGVRELAARPEILDDVPFWREQTRGDAGLVPLDVPGGRERNTEDSLEIVRVELDPAETEALLHDVPQVFHGQIHEALLTALARTLGAWKGEEAVAVEVELHGREESRLGDVDLSRTVGWFTASYPVRLEVDASAGPADALAAVRRRLRAVPGRGFSYGLARWLSPDGPAVGELRAAPRPDVNFNYLGRFDQALGPSSRFRLAPPELPMGPDRDPRGERTCGIDVVGWVVGERLRMEWYFSRNAHRRDRVEGLAAEHLGFLRELIAAARAESAEGAAAPAGAAAGDRSEGAGEPGAEAVYGLSPLQEGLLYHAIADPDSGMYVNQALLTLRGDLDEDAMAEAWRRGMAAHAILRTSFAWEGRESPVQVVARETALPFERHDVASLAPEERRARREGLLEERRRGGFDPSRGPLMRIDLLRTGEREHELIWSFHHLLLDGWSMFSVLKDVFGAYEALRAGGDPVIASPPPFRDHVEWLGRQDPAAAEAYWRRTLRGFGAPTPIPGATGRAAPSVGLDDAGFAAIRLDRETTVALEALARRQHVTMNTVLQLAWAVVLARWSGEDDVVFGQIVSGRPPDLPGFESMVGLFINTLPVRVALRDGDTVGEALRRLQSDLAELRQFEHSRLVDVQQWSEVPAGKPVFESILLFENYRKEMPLAAMLESLEVEDVGWFEHTNYPVALLAIPEDEFLLRLVVHRSRVDQETADRILQHVKTAIESMVAAPDARVADVSLLGRDEEAGLRAEWTAIAPAAGAEPVHEAFARCAAERPDAEAVRDARESVTYGELDRRANRLARHLKELGVGPDVRVGVCLRPSVRLPEALLAALKAGGAYVPLDPDYPADRLAYMAADSGAAVIVGERETLMRLGAAGDGANGGSKPQDAGSASGAPVTVALDAEAEAIGVRSAEPLASTTHPRQLAYVIYTSGSTGRPKGVEVDHGALSNLVAWHRREYAIAPEDRATLVAAFSFDASVWETWPYLAAGASLHIPDEETRAAGDALLSWMGERGVTACFLPTPVAAAALADGAEWPGSLRAVLTGGDRLTRGPASDLPFRFVNHYGPTENAVVATAADVATGSELPPIGRAIDGVGAYVLDRGLRPSPVGVPGQLWLGGASLARGYRGRPDLTAERFLPDPYGPAGARMYATGDLVRRRADGELEFLGRIDRQVKLRGFRIETGEIESVLARHAAVRRAVVELREDRPGQPQLVAYLVADGAAPAVEELRAHLRRTLPDYMVPSAFVTLPELPLTPNGKINRAALPAPDREARGAAKTIVAPRNEVEEKLVDVWRRLLDLEKVGVDDNFFDLGANSLLLVRARSEIRKALDTEIGIVDLFEHPTVAALATHAVRKRSGADAAGETEEAEAEEAATRAAGRSRLLQRRRRTGGTDD